MKTLLSKIIISGMTAAAFNITPTADAQSFYPGQFKELTKTEMKGATPVRCVPLSNVRLLPGRFKENMERDSAWLLSISTDRLLHSFRNNSGVFAGKEGGYMTVKKLGGWESLDCELRGHTTGHYLSAVALMYAATGDESFKTKGDSIVNGLAEVQQALGNGYLSAFPEQLVKRNINGTSVWAPWYTLHKLLAGLIDQYLYTGNQLALETAVKFGEWAYATTSQLDEPTRLRMLRNEFGGINEAFFNLYAITGDSRFRSLAKFFYHPDVIDPLKNGDGNFGTKHTNTFIPKVLGEIRDYEINGDEDALNAARFFWSEMIGHHTFAPGCSSDKEHYFKPEDFSKHISGYTGETCCTYNMLKLSRHLFCASPSSEIADYYERALYNHILGQQDPESGMVAYFLPLKTGTHRVYSTPENSFWCCVGSGFENHAKYGESIWFEGDGCAYLNLFIPSVFSWEEKGMTLTQTTDFPASGSTTLSISATTPATATINIRYPQWATKAEVRVNGKKIAAKKNPEGYISLKRTWKEGDKIDVNFGMSLHKEATPDDPSKFALLYGPIVLAGRLGTEGIVGCAPFSDPSKYNDYYTYDYNIPDGLDTISLDVSGLTRVAPLKWETPDGLTIEPLYDVHRERYAVYWDEPAGENSATITK